jgi:RNA polymerase sigma-70 factor, ECF subfamily
MQLWRNPAAFDTNRGSLAAWLAVIARNRAIDALRKRRPESNIEDVVVAADIDLESEAARKIAVEKVRGVLAGMPAEQRRAIELAFFEGLTHTEVAAKLGEPLGTVKTRIRSALQALRKVMA